MITGNKGQLSYEYIIVIGMVLLLAIPFFYSFFRYLLGGYDNQMNADMVVRVSHATETLANLGGVGSKFTVPVRISKITQNTLQNNLISVKTSNGQTYSAPALPNIKLGSKALVGEGLITVPLIYTYLDTMVIGSQPQIVGICPEGASPYSSQCSTTTKITPSAGFLVLGANYEGASEVILSKITKSGGGCSTMTSCISDSDCLVGNSCVNGICAEINPPSTLGEGGLLLDVSTSKTGKGDYDVAVVNPGSEISGCVYMSVTTQPILDE